MATAWPPGLGKAERGGYLVQRRGGPGADPGPIPILPLRAKSRMNALLEDNRRALRQGLDVVAELDAELYGDPHSCRTGATIGAHFRHIIDHYTAFFAGLESGRVEYERRDRDVRIERDSDFASSIARELMDQLEGLEGCSDQPLLLVCRAGAEAEHAEGFTDSSIKRELQFLLSHTVHHYALIAAELRVRGRVVPPGFGVAPSTLGYLRGKAA